MFASMEYIWNCLLASSAGFLQFTSFRLPFKPPLDVYVVFRPFLCSSSKFFVFIDSYIIQRSLVFGIHFYENCVCEIIIVQWFCLILSDFIPVS